MIKVICVGKIKEDYLAKATIEYLKRLSAFTKIQIVEVKEYNNKTIQENLNLEGAAILDKINKDDYVITLEILGREIDSIALSKLITDTLNYQSTNIDFVIGGSNGLSNQVKERSNYQLSFSKLTFPHQLMRVILLEQIYRSFTIINNKEYHK